MDGNIEKKIEWQKKQNSYKQLKFLGYYGNSNEKERKKH